MKPFFGMPIERIKVGKRHRQDVGDLKGLAESIASIGLLHPIVVRSDGHLIAGARRLRACKLLKKKMVDVHVMDLDAIVRGEYEENIQRKDFTWSEAVAIKRELEPLEKAAAKERQVASGGKGRVGVGKLPEPKQAKGRATDKAAKATRKSRRSLEKAAAVVDAAEKNPETFGDLVEQMDENDNVDKAFNELRIRQERSAFESRRDMGARVEDLVAMAERGEKFKVIYADPPWEFEVYSGKGKQRSAERHYDTASLDDIKALPVAALADDDCLLMLWGVSPEMPGALEVIKAWGFEYKTVGFLWVKTTPSATQVALDGDGLHWGMGYWTRANVEPVLLATKGKPQRMAKDVHQVVVAPVGPHSEKPEEVRLRIERLVVGPYLELFGRKPVPGWTVWGNEIEAAQDAAE